MKRFVSLLVAGVAIAFAFSIVTPVFSPILVLAADSDGESETGEPIWIQGARTVINLVIEGDYKTACAYLDDRRSEIITPKSLGKAWTAWLEEAGEFKSLGNATMALQDSLHVVRVEGNFQWKNGIFTVAWTEEGAVAGFGIQPEEAKKVKNKESKEPAKSDESSP